MNKKVMKLASKGKRLGAFCLDEIIPAILHIVLFSSVCAMFVGSNVVMYGDGFGYSYGTGNIGSSLISFTIATFVYLIYLIVQIVFYTKSKTIGKALLGMQVVSSKDGNPVSVWIMIVREWFAKKASGVVFCLGYIWILIDDKNRAWHDKIMDTYVIDVAETDAMNKPKNEVKEVVELAVEASEEQEKQEQPAYEIEDKVEIIEDKPEDSAE